MREELIITITPGTATAEEIAEILSDFNKLYKMMGGSGIKFKIKEKSISLQNPIKQHIGNCEDDESLENFLKELK